ADPYFLPALLQKGAWLDRMGNGAAAATTYRNAVKIAPSEKDWPAELRSGLNHARAFADRHGAALHAQLGAALKPVGGLSGPAAERWREAASIMAGRTQPYVQHANQLHVPRLPPIPFHDRSQFPWAAEVEAKTDAIREELKAALASEGKEFAPYIAL